jgi:hypothetical protein
MLTVLDCLSGHPSKNSRSRYILTSVNKPLNLHGHHCEPNIYASCIKVCFVMNLSFSVAAKSSWLYVQRSIFDTTTVFDSAGSKVLQLSADVRKHLGKVANEMKRRYDAGIKPQFDLEIGHPSST